MKQTFLYLMGPDDQISALSRRLKAEEFSVGPSGRMTGGVHVRIREETGDEDLVMRIAGEVAPNVRRGPGGSPSMSIDGYREGR